MYYTIAIVKNVKQSIIGPVAIIFLQKINAPSEWVISPNDACKSTYASVVVPTIAIFSLQIEIFV
jgi:hypothetical protein